MTIQTKHVNVARVLQVLREQGAASRVEICRRTGLSPAAVTNITRELIEQGYVVSQGTVAGGRGHPVEMLKYDAQCRVALGVELHDQALVGVLTDLYARPVHTCRVAPVGDGLDAFLAGLDKWRAEIGPSMGDKECAAVGIAIPGLVNQQTGCIQWTTEFNLPPVPIVDILGERLCRRPTVTNRTYAAALAEAWLGVAQESTNLVYIRLGDYVGGAILIDGLPYWGSYSAAGSVGHITVDPNGLPCRCGARGCLDTIASGRAIARRAREGIRQGRASSLTDRAHSSLETITGEMVMEEAKAGDSLALDVLHEVAQSLGIAVGILVNLLGPDTVVLGGHIGRQADAQFLGWIQDSVRQRAYALPAGQTRLVASALGDEAVACGAAATALWTNLTRSVNLHVA